MIWFFLGEIGWTVRWGSGRLVCTSLTIQAIALNFSQNIVNLTLLGHTKHILNNPEIFLSF